MFLPHFLKKNEYKHFWCMHFQCHRGCQKKADGSKIGDLGLHKNIPKYPFPVFNIHKILRTIKIYSDLPNHCAAILIILWGKKTLTQPI